MSSVQPKVTHQHQQQQQQYETGRIPTAGGEQAPQNGTNTNAPKKPTGPGGPVAPAATTTTATSDARCKRSKSPPRSCSGGKPGPELTVNGGGVGGATGPATSTAPSTIRGSGPNGELTLKDVPVSGISFQEIFKPDHEGPPTTQVIIYKPKSGRGQPTAKVIVTKREQQQQQSLRELNIVIDVDNIELQTREQQLQQQVDWEQRRLRQEMQLQEERPHRPMQQQQQQQQQPLQQEGQRLRGLLLVHPPELPAAQNQAARHPEQEPEAVAVPDDPPQRHQEPEAVAAPVDAPSAVDYSVHRHQEPEAVATPADPPQRHQEPEAVALPAIAPPEVAQSVQHHAMQEMFNVEQPNANTAVIEPLTGPSAAPDDCAVVVINDEDVAEPVPNTSNEQEQPAYREHSADQEQWAVQKQWPDQEQWPKASYRSEQVGSGAEDVFALTPTPPPPPSTPQTDYHAELPNDELSAPLPPLVEDEEVEDEEVEDEEVEEEEVEEEEVEEENEGERQEVQQNEEEYDDQSVEAHPTTSYDAHHHHVYMPTISYDEIRPRQRGTLYGAPGPFSSPERQNWGPSDDIHYWDRHHYQQQRAFGSTFLSTNEEHTETDAETGSTTTNSPERQYEEPCTPNDIEVPMHSSQRSE
uniref:Uncharacterized protein n=1 Tax=Anopheles melas TaxID=34690 RepID=A0A182TV14_9DIPT